MFASPSTPRTSVYLENSRPRNSSYRYDAVVLPHCHAVIQYDASNHAIKQDERRIAHKITVISQLSQLADSNSNSNTKESCSLQAFILHPAVQADLHQCDHLVGICNQPSSSSLHTDPIHYCKIAYVRNTGTVWAAISLCYDDQGAAVSCHGQYYVSQTLAQSTTISPASTVHVSFRSVFRRLRPRQGLITDCGVHNPFIGS
ncbi:hypothetical protein J1614_003249 [Plenodomus biglobosus]|nr:hypothetical protein J1614_003249 [Plenodomus biglobosus]